MRHSEFVAVSGKAGTIRGILGYPESYNCTQQYPIVIVVVGLNGNRVDLNRILIDLSRELQSSGFFCLRFDFYGMGVSDGFFSESTVTSKTNDLVQVYEYVKSSVPNTGRLYFLSLSDGMQVVLSAAAQNKGIRNSHFIFWSPVIVDIENKAASTTIRSRPHKDAFSNKLCLPFLGLWISLDYLKEKKYIDFYKCFFSVAADIQPSSIFLYADNDSKVEDTVQILMKHGFNRFRVISGGGHSFCTYESHWEVIDQTLTAIQAYETEKVGSLW